MQRKKPVQVKIVIYDGLIDRVLSDGDLNVEIINADKCYTDFEEKLEHIDALESSGGFMPQPVDYYVAGRDDTPSPRRASTPRRKRNTREER